VCGFLSCECARILHFPLSRCLFVIVVAAIAAIYVSLVARGTMSSDESSFIATDSIDGIWPFLQSVSSLAVLSFRRSSGCCVANIPSLDKPVDRAAFFLLCQLTFGLRPHVHACVCFYRSVYLLARARRSLRARNSKILSGRARTEATFQKERTVIIRYKYIAVNRMSISPLRSAAISIGIVSHVRCSAERQTFAVHTLCICFLYLYYMVRIRSRIIKDTLSRDMQQFSVYTPLPFDHTSSKT